MLEHFTKKYDPYQLGISGYTLLGGIHYRIPVGSNTDIEAGIAAGWTAARFDFSSTWSFSADYQEDAYYYSFTDGGTLEGKGSGNGFAAQAMLRLNRMLGKRFGFFIEAAGNFCRIKSLEGTGRETRLGIPGETTWEGPWAIKKEEISMSWGDASVSVPTNYWNSWIESQRERDFILNLSGLRMVVGIIFRF